MCPGGRYALRTGTLGVKVIVLEGDTPSVRGTLVVKVCFLGKDTPSVRGTLGVKVCVLGGRYALSPGYS